VELRVSEKRKKCGELSGNKGKSGKPCGAWPLKGREVCLAHADAKTRQSVGFVSDNGKAGRPRVPTATELMRKVVEENVSKILAPHFKVLGYELKIEGDSVELVAIEGGGAKLHGESKEGVIKASGFEDLGAMVAAAERLLDRALGRPKQSTEITGPGGGPIEHEHVSVPTDQQFHEDVAKLLAEAEAVKADAAGSSA
jgi:hypothetical protein